MQKIWEQFWEYFSGFSYQKLFLFAENNLQKIKNIENSFHFVNNGTFNKDKLKQNDMTSQK